MKLKKIAKTLIFGLFLALLTGCVGFKVGEYNILATVKPDITGAFVLEAQVSNDDFETYASNNNLTDRQQVAEHMANDIADRLKWTFPHETSMRQDGNYVWIQMWVRFTDSDTFCSFFPAADDATTERGEEAVGKGNVYSCTLEKSSTPFTDIYFYKDTIFPGGGDNGKLTMLLPGSVADTNGALVEDNGVAWTWTKDGVAVPMYLYTAGLVDFKLSLNVSIDPNGTSNLIIITTAPKSVLAYAPSMYSSSDSAQALATRIANGLNLSNYQVSSKDVGSQVEISIVISDLSQEQLQATLNQSGLLSQVIVKANSSFLNGHYEFSGNLNSWKSYIGYPDSITLNVTMPGQSGTQSWIANGNTQPISTVSEFTNWFGILGIGLVCVLMIGGVFALLAGVFILRRKKV